MGSTAYFTRFGQCSEKGNSLASSREAETQPESKPSKEKEHGQCPALDTWEKVKGLPKDQKATEPQIPPS